MLFMPITYGFIVCIGYVLKKISIFRNNDYKVVSRIVLNITMPCSILQVFKNIQEVKVQYSLILVGFLCAFIPILLFTFFTKNRNKEESVFTLLNIGGYSIGCFTLPIVQQVFGNEAAITACLFDIGNAIMMTGGSFIYVSIITRERNQRLYFKDVLKKFSKSVPFMTYLLMLVISICNIELPNVVINLTSPIANANIFLTMLLIGMMFNNQTRKSIILKSILLILKRILIAIVFMILLQTIFHFEKNVCKIILICLLSPISILVPVYTEKFKCNVSHASYVNSLSIFISLILIAILVINN